MAILLLSLGLLALALWRSASDLQGHVRAGAQLFLEALSSQSGLDASGAPHPSADHGVPAELPGLGNARALRLGPHSPAVGRTLRQLDLRGLTGATVIAIDRASSDVVYPTADETLRAGDTLVVIGSAGRRAILRAMEIGPLRERVSKLQSRLEVLRGHL
jgi:CPA2 family monovalent cation:H+ antiporter-2